MASMIDRMLDQANALIADHPRSSAAKRRAVSAAYYAVFHKLMWTCAREFLPAEDVSSTEFERVYRGIDHGSVKNAFQPQGPFRTIEALKRIGTDFVQLQEARINADYSPPRPKLFELSEVKEHIERARTIIRGLENLTDQERQTLAVNLLFQARKK